MSDDVRGKKSDTFSTISFGMTKAIIRKSKNKSEMISNEAV